MHLNDIKAVKFDFKIGKLNVFVKNNDSIRIIELTHQHKTEGLLPPASWLSQVEAEVKFQEAEELLKKSGKFLPYY